MSAQRSFTISTPVPNVRADAEGRAAIVYTVTNTSGLPNRALARVVPLGDTRAEWLALEGQSEREFPTGALHQFTVAAKLPAEASGRYSLRLDILSARKGGEEAYDGPVVTIETTATAATAKPSRWWLWAAALVLFAIVGVAGALVMRDDAPQRTDTVMPATTTTAPPEDPNIVAVPDVISTPVARAEYQLDTAGLKTSRKPVTDSAATPGTIRMTAPRPGAKVARGTTVELEVVVAPAVVVTPAGPPTAVVVEPAAEPVVARPFMFAPGVVRRAIVAQQTPKGGTQ